MSEKDQLNKELTILGVDPRTIQPGQPDLDPTEEPDVDEENTSYDDKISLPEPEYAARVQSAFNKDGSVRKVITANKTAFVHNMIYLDGKKFDFTGREYLHPIYNRKDSRILLKTARQVEKTTFLANNLTADSVVIPYNKSLYVSPSHTQTRQFSNEKLRPAIEKSPLIKRYFQDHTVSTQVFEKGFSNGSYIFLRSAFRSADRCVAEGTRISLSNGSVRKVEDLVAGNKLLSFDGRGGLTAQPCREVWSSGVKPCASVKLRSGQEVVASLNHRWVTEKGLLTTADLLGRWVPIPLNFFTDAVRGDLTYDLLGMFLGDSCMAKSSNCSKYRLSFNNNDLEFIEHFREVAGKLGLLTNLTHRVQKKKINYTATITKETKSLATKILSDFGVIGKIWSDRFIPECVFGSRDRTVRVLRGMFESDGWVTYSEKNSQFEVGWVSESERLARDVQYCLQGLGVFSTLQERQPFGRSKSISYNVKIRSIEHIIKFRDVVGFISSRKTSTLKEAIDLALSTCAETNSSLDCPAREDINLALLKAGISDHSLWEKHKISWRKNSTTNKERVSTCKVKRIYVITKDERLLKYISDQVLWVEVTSVKEVGIKKVFDLSVERDEVFTANGVLTHNTRGISARNLCLDELQDFLGSEIPVILECTSHFLDARVLFAGTPKSHDNPIEEYWKETSQNEWLVPCSSCGKWNFLDETNIAPTELYLKDILPPGPVCKKCAKPINVRNGKWFSTATGKMMQGYRIPQLMVPWICGLKDQWLRLLWKRDNYPIGQFYNEVLGISYDSASKPITRDDLISICDAYDMWHSNDLNPKVIEEARRMQLTAGVDWGEGNDGSEKSPTGKIRNASYTVLTVGGYINQKQYGVKLVKKYEGKEIDPDFIVKDIARVVNALDVKLVGVDWGHGWGVNNHLIRLLGPKRVVQFQYLPKLKEKLKWDHIGFRYQLQRNFIMSELFYDLKNGGVRFPRWAQMEKYAADILAIFAEYVEFRREIKYDHKSTDPDDFFHSLNFSKLASDIYLGKSRRYSVYNG